MLVFHDNWYSASDLIKKSASQITFFKKKRENITNMLNKRIEEGVKFQHEVAVEKGCAAEEFRTTVKYKDIIIFACHDLITDDAFIEVKNIDDDTKPIPSWYLESSLLQCAFYKSLLLLSNSKVISPKFRIKEGYDRQVLRVNINNPYILHIGNDEYEVTLNEEDSHIKIVEYFYQKASMTSDYDIAHGYDNKHKFQHFKELSKHFTYRKINK